MRYSKNQDIFGDTQGDYNFSGIYTGNAVADFLLGYAGQLQRTRPGGPHPHAHLYGLILYQRQLARH